MNQKGARPTPISTEREGDTQLRDLVNLVRRNLGLITIITALIVGVTGYLTWTAPPVYQASTTIHVDPNRPAMAELGFIGDMLRTSDVDTEMALLRARSLAEATVDSLSLQVALTRPFSTERGEVFSELSASRLTQTNTYRFQRDGDTYRITDHSDREIEQVGLGQAFVFNGVRLVIDPTDPEGLPNDFQLSTYDFYEAVESLMQRLNVGRPYRDASVVSVSYEGQGRHLVQQIPNILASLFIQRRGEAKKTEAVSTVAFLEDQIADHQMRLRQAEEDRLAFQQGAQVVNIRAEGAEQVRQLVEAEATKRDTEGRLTSLSSLLDDIDRRSQTPSERSPYRALASFPTFMQNQAVTQLLSELNQIEAERTAQLELRTVAHPDVVAMTGQINQLETQLYDLATNHRQVLRSEVMTSDERLTEFNTSLERIPQNEIQLERLSRQIRMLEQIFTTLQNRLQEARVAQAVEPGDVRIVDQAITPANPIRPQKARAVALAIIFGLLISLGAAAARDFLDETVHSREDLVKIVKLPVLGMIPRMKGNGNGAWKLLTRNGADPDRLVTRSDIDSPVSEAYRAFRTNITFLSIDDPPQVIVITSPGPAEGKSTCVTNLAITLAQQDTSTLVVDCDLRRGVVHKVFESAKKDPGLTNLLLGEVSFSESVRSVEIMKDKFLDYLPTGTLPPNPSELLGSQQMLALIQRLRERYKIILLDSPPLNLVTDAAVLGTVVDSVILIARAGVTDRGALRYATEQLVAVNAPLSGVVLNDVDFEGRGRYYGSGYGYRYDSRYRQDVKNK